MNTWEQRADENNHQYYAFQLFCKGLSYSKICELAGYSKGTLTETRRKKNWDARRAAYKATEGVVDSATTITEDLVTAALALGHAINIEPVEVADGTGNSKSNDGVKFENTGTAEDLTEEEGDDVKDSNTISPVTVSQENTSLEQRVVKIKFYLNQTAQNIIEVGKELTAAKQEVPHGEWQAWLNDNFGLSKSTANNFMRCAERFSNFQSIGNFNSTQLIQLLALPESETEKFIEQKAAEGNPVEDMTVKQLREEVKIWKDRAADEKAKVENLFADLEKAKDRRATAERETAFFKKEFNSQLDKTEEKRQELQAAKEVIEEQALENSKLQSRVEELESRPPSVIEKTTEVIPADYESSKQENVELKQQILKLQEQLSVSPAPVDYDAAKRAEVFIKLDTVFALLSSLDDQSQNFIQAYFDDNPDKFDLISRLFYKK